MSTRSTVVVLAAATLSACTSSRGFDRGALRGVLAGDASEIADAEISEALELKPQLPTPYKLAVLFAEPKATGAMWVRDRTFWLGADKDLILGMGNELQRRGIVSDIILLITATFVPGDELDAVFLTNASVWDVRNQYLYVTAEAGDASRGRPNRALR